MANMLILNERSAKLKDDGLEKSRHKQQWVAADSLWGFYSCHIALMECRDPSVL